MRYIWKIIYAFFKLYVIYKIVKLIIGGNLFNRVSKNISKIHDKLFCSNNKLSEILAFAIYRTRVIKHPNGVSWFKNGLLHRDNGPAVITKSGTKEWYKRGKLHRTDGPAVEDDKLKNYEYWYEGKLHREDGPAVITKYEKTWYRHGKIHRDNGPAIIYNSLYSKNCRCRWYVNGILQKIKTQSETRYYYNSDLHREDGPAIDRKCGCKTWYLDGIKHRTDGPAVIRCEKHTGLAPYKEWWQDGDLHRIDGPAKLWKNGSEYWYDWGVLHREDGPAITLIEDNLIDVSIEKNWMIDGVFHRANGPAVTTHINGIKLYERYYLKGKLHNSIGPAYINYNPQIRSKFYIDGKNITLDQFVKRFEERMKNVQRSNDSRTTNERQNGII